jgi:hypothetical protein
MLKLISTKLNNFSYQDMWHNFIEIYKLILTILSVLFLMLSHRKLLYTIIIIISGVGLTPLGTADLLHTYTHNS